MSETDPESPSSPHEVMLTPWPKREAHAGLGLSKEEKEEIHERNRNRRQEILSKKQRVSPQFSVILSPVLGEPLELCVPDGRIKFRITLRYDQTPEYFPKGSPNIVLQPPPLLQPKALLYGNFDISTSPDFDSVLFFDPPKPLMRKPKDAPSTFRISGENGWTEMAPGGEISHDLVLNLPDFKAWQEKLEPGKTYWLRYNASSGHALCSPEIPSSNWRFGTLSDFEGKDCDGKENDLYIGIPLSRSNMLEIRTL